MKAIALPATRFDAEQLACFMRASDIEECKFNAAAFGRDRIPGWSIRGDLMDALEDSEVWSMWFGDKFLGLGGCRRGDPVSAIWFLGTDLADEHPIAMTRCSRRFVNMAVATTPGVIGNVVPKTMAQRVAWLQHLGFDMRDGEAQSALQGHVIFWIVSPSAPKTTQRPR